MLERNKRIKPAPERFQDCKERFDVIFSFEERVYDLVSSRFSFIHESFDDLVQIVEYMSARPEEDGQPVHVINIDVQDNHEEATIGAFVVCELASMVRLCSCRRRSYARCSYKHSTMSTMKSMMY